MEQCDATISSKYGDYGSTTLKSHSPIANRHRNETQQDTNDSDNSDHLVGHCVCSSTPSKLTVGYQSLPEPGTTYTASLFAAAKCKPKATRFPAPRSRFSRYAYSKMDSFIDENPASKLSKWNTQILQRFESFLFLLNQMCIGFVAIYMTWLCIRNGLQKTPLHAWLVTLGYSLLMAEAVMVHYNANPLTTHYKRHQKHTIHWVLQLLGGGLGMGGTLYKCIQKGFLLTSIHGKLGFATFILCLVSWLSGLCALYQFKLKSRLRPVFNRTFHNLIGFACFVLALLSQYYGYETGFFKSRTDSDFRVCIKCITLISLVLSCVGPIKALIQKTLIICRD